MSPDRKKTGPTSEQRFVVLEAGTFTEKSPPRKGVLSSKRGESLGPPTRWMS